MKEVHKLWGLNLSLNPGSLWRAVGVTKLCGPGRYHAPPKPSYLGPAQTGSTGPSLSREGLPICWQKVLKTCLLLPKPHQETLMLQTSGQKCISTQEVIGKSLLMEREVSCVGSGAVTVHWSKATGKQAWSLSHRRRQGPWLQLSGQLCGGVQPDSPCS